MQAVRTLKDDKKPSMSIIHPQKNMERKKTDE